MMNRKGLLGGDEGDSDGEDDSIFDFSEAKQRGEKNSQC